MKNRYYYILIVFAVLLGQTAKAQSVSVSTNFLDWINLGTVNVEASLALSQHMTVNAGARFNPWEFHKKDPYMVIQEKQIEVSAGARWWFWYVYSGWWAGAKLQYQDFKESGLWRPTLETGKRAGLGLSAGYTLMISKHLNLEFGLGFWGGWMFEHILYYSPATDDIRESSPGPFFAPDLLSVSLVYVF